MSIIVQMPNGDILLFSKGADYKVIGKLSLETKYLEKTQKFLIEFGKKGLRTLLIAYRKIDPELYSKWKEDLDVYNLFSFDLIRNKK